MKSANVAMLVTLSLILCCVGGCRKRPDKGVTYIPASSGPGIGGPGPNTPTGPITTGLPLGGDPNATAIPANPDGGYAQPELKDRGNFWEDRESLKEQTVYFEFDSSEVMPAERPKIESVASFMKSQPTFQLEVEGHCDERGTSEYNRALGDRRALSVREVLILLGVSPERVQTISYGEDKPAVIGNNEAAWAKNRRAEFIILKPKL